MREKMVGSITGVLMILVSISSFSQVLPFPEDTIAYNELFNNRQWVQYDSQGNLHIAYTGQLGTSSHTREIYYVTNQSGSFVTTQLTENEVDSNYSVFAIDDEDNIHLVYIERDNSNNFQLLYRNNTTGVFSTPVSITSGTNKGPAYITWSGDDIVHFVYHTFINGSPDHAYYKTYDLNTQTLGTEVMLAASDAGSEHDVRVVADNNNHAHVVLRSGSLWGGPLKYYNNTSGAMQEYALPVDGNTEYPAMVLDNNDNLHIIYRASSSNQIYYLEGDVAGNFSLPVAATPSGIGSPSFYRTIDTDDEGRVYFTYQNSISTAPKGFFLVHGADGVFEEPILVWNDPADAYLLRNTNGVAARGNGEIAVVYAPSAVRDEEVICDIFLKQGNIYDEPLPLIEVSPLVMDFGTVAVDSYTEQTLTISNPGFATLNFSLSFSDSNFFSPTDGPLSVEAQGSIEIPVAYQPAQAGAHTAQLTISSNAANNPEVIVDLAGNAEAFYTLTFMVSDQQLDPVADAVISLNDEEFPAGQYIFEDLVAGEYSYTVQKEGFEMQEGTVGIVDEDVTEEVILYATTYTVTFELLNNENQVVQHAVVTFAGQQNAAGDYFFPGIAPGSYTYFIEADGFFDAEGEVIVTDQDVEITIYLEEDDTFVVGIKMPRVRIFPNPANSQVTVSSEFYMTEVSVVDMQGRILIKKKEAGHTISLPIAHLDNGIYIVQITTSDQILLRKLQVSH